MSFNFLIVDDERLSRLYIQKLILEFLPDAVIYETKSTAAAKDILRNGNIDVLFLDIRMPEETGFELLSHFKDRTFDTVFITAYEQYAIEAIRNGAVDYILKPINKREFKSMLERLLALKDKRAESRARLIPEDDKEAYLTRKIAINNQSGIKFVAISDILYLKALNTYTSIHHASGLKTLVSKAISRFDESLDRRWFFRIHKSYIINLKYFSSYISTDGHFVEMENGDRIPVSRHRLKEFMDVIRNNSENIKSSP